MMSTNTGKKKFRRKRKVNHKEDRLSNLPDEILTKILSCLKTKEAVRTGILSTRWKSVWVSVPTLDLCESDFYFNEDDNEAQKFETRFYDFMDRVLVARKLPCLEKIRIHGQKCNPYLMKSWMYAALERNVSELYVVFSRLYYDAPCEFTHDLFSYNKLVVLKLCLDMTLYFPTASSCFPYLKVLELEDFLYKDDDSFPNLLSSCPVLEDLTIIRSTWDKLGTLNITSRSMKRLKVYSYFDDPVEQMKMVIDAPAVESLDIYCVKTEEYVVKDLSSIVDAKLDLYNGFSFSKTCKLLRDVSNVKFLRLDSCTVEALELSDYSYNLPMFYNLTRLEIHGDDHSEGNDYCDGESSKSLQWKFMLEILKSSPILQILIYEAFSYSLQECGKASDWDVPNCLVSCLKTVEFYYYSDDDVEKVRYFLINAQVLEKMTIRSFSLNKSLRSSLGNVIFEIKRGSLTWSDKEIVISFL